MSLLYKNPEDVIYSVHTESIGPGLVRITFSSDGGKFGTDEIIDEYEIEVKDLQSLLFKLSKF